VNWFKAFWKSLTAPPGDAQMISLESTSNFTPRAQQVLALARREADRLNHNFVGTEHILLGLVKLGQGVAVNVLQRRGVDLETVRKEDVYCRESGGQVVVYRSALFRSRRRLLSARQQDGGAEFLELEQSNGQTVYLSLPSVIRFCEAGTEVVGEIVTLK
jgi:hypothetical protein